MTPARDSKPTTRLVGAALRRHGPASALVVTLGERTMTIRPRGCRASGPAAVVVDYATLYERLLMARVAAVAKRRPRR